MSPIDWHVNLFKQERHGADVILMAVGQHDRNYFIAIFVDKRKIRYDYVNTRLVFFGKAHSGVDYDGLVAVAYCHHVHPELADAPQRDYLKSLILHIEAVLG
jgi:hypothetical protein